MVKTKRAFCLFSIKILTGLIILPSAFAADAKDKGAEETNSWNESVAKDEKKFKFLADDGAKNKIGETGAKALGTLVDTFIEVSNRLEQEEKSPTSTQAKEQSKSKNSLVDKILNGLKELTLRYNVGKDFEIFDGAELNMKYSHETEPAFYGRYFSRMDRYKLQPKLSIIEALGQESNANVALSVGLDIRFFQFFEDYGQAISPKNIYSPIHLPTDSDKALNRLKPGDLVSFEGNMSVHYGLKEIFDYWDDQLELVPSIGHLRDGRFRVYVFRGDNDMVRLRVGYVHSSPNYIKGEVSLLDLFDFGWNPLTNLAERLLKLNNFAEMQLEKFDRETLITDFTLNMRDERVKVAYNALFDRNTRVDSLIAGVNPFASEEDLRDKLLLNVEPLIDLSKATSKDKNPAVVMNFQGSNFSDGSQTSVEAGTPLAIRGRDRTTKQHNRMKQVVYDSEGNAENKFYVFPSWVNKKRMSALATKWEEESARSSNIIYEADEDYNIVQFNNIGFYRDEVDKEFEPGEHRDLLRQIQKKLPKHVFEEYVAFLKQNNWYDLDDTKNNVRVSTRFFIHEEALKLANSITEQQMEDKLLQAVKSMDEVSTRKVLVPRTGPAGKCLKQYGYKYDHEGYHVGYHIFENCERIKRTAHTLRRALNNNRKTNARNEAFVSLVDNPLFQDVGPAVLFNLLPKNSVDSTSYFEITINSSDLDEALNFHHGELENRRFYEIVLQIENIMSNDRPDLRLPGPTESATTRIYGSEHTLKN